MSWRTILVVFGCVGFVWVFAWKRWFRDEPTEHPAANEAERALIIADRPPESCRNRAAGHYWRKLLQPAQRAAAVPRLHAELRHVLFLHHLAAYLPARAPRLREDAARACWPRCRCSLSIGTQFLGGFWSDMIVAPLGLHGRPAHAGHPWLRAGGGVHHRRDPVQPDPITAAVLIALAAATCMLTTATAWSTCVDIGREHSATVSATMNTSGQIAAMASAPVVGYSVKWFGDWNVPFWLLAGLFVMGAPCWVFVDPKKPVFGDLRQT